MSPARARHETTVLVHLDVLAANDLDSAAREEIIDLCESAYGEDFSRLFEELHDSVHVLARDDRGRLVSHAEWVTRWLQPAEHRVLRTAYVEAVATEPRHQRKGLASTVLRHVNATLRSDPMWELGALCPSVPAFYARHGWELWLGPLGIRRGDGVEPTVAGEQVMVLRLPRTPTTLTTTALLTAEWRTGEPW